MVESEEEDFVLVERAESDDDDDAVSVSSSRSSLCLVEDPSNDSLMLHGESPLKRSVAPPPNADEEAVDRETPLPPSTEADVPIPKALEEKALPQEPQEPEQPKFVCSTCSLEVGMQSDIVWEGYMGANKSAYLFSKVANLAATGLPRKQQLSTGQFLLQDVRCRSCSAAFGWTYLKAWNQDQKYKEGTTIVERSLLQLVDSTPSESTATTVHCQ